jgi:Uma2 family endonuclease
MAHALLELAVPTLPPPEAAPTLSFADYLVEYDGQRAEWLMGSVEVYMANNIQHQLILLFLAKLLGLYLDTRRRGLLLLAGVPMYLGEDKPARQPDLMVVMNENRGRLRETYLDGPADIAVEIVSPESVQRDYGEKFHEYEAAGVREYWLIDPERRIVDVYSLGEDKRYHRQNPSPNSRIVSPLLAPFALDPQWFWAADLNELDVLALLAQMTA